MSLAVRDAAASVGPAARSAVTIFGLAAALTGAVVAALLAVAPELLRPLGGLAPISAMPLSLYAAAAVFLMLGGVLASVRPGLGGAILLIGSLFWLAGCIAHKSFSWALAIPLALGVAGALTGMIASDRATSQADARLVYRQDVMTRLTHWLWAACLFFLLLTGLQIFNARPNLYIGHESGFAYDNSILDIYAVRGPNGLEGRTRLFGHEFDTTGWLGVSGPADRPDMVAFPSWATIPSFRDLATGRVVHFFFAWVLVGTLGMWLVNALSSGRLWRDVVLKPHDLRQLPGDIWNHLRFRFAHGRSYSPLQKLSYFGVLFVAFPLIILTGLAMSPGMNAAWPWLVDIFGGRQTARTIHFFTMMAFVLFVIVHVAMVVLAGPVNELRSMITGYYRIGRKDRDG